MLLVDLIILLKVADIMSEKIFKTIILLSIYLFFLLLFYLVHIYYFDVDVIFYSALFDSLLAVVAISVLFRFTFNCFNSYEKFLLILVLILGGYSFSISVPTVIDRSLSFYILEKLNQRGGGILENKMEDVFVKEYMKEYRLVDVRMTEQLESGTIEIIDGCVRLTEKGKKISEISSFFRQNFLAKHRLLMGSYTDDLLNPFENSIPTPNYICR